ncbi:MAG: MBL fold metallo-hydrolase [Gammaproteobacteria bacterium]
MHYQHITDLPFDIACIDVLLFRPRLACCYLIRGGNQYGLVETGTTHSAPQILNTLKYKGVSEEDLLYIMPTHVHLDHAGGAGALMQRFPNATLVIHPKGARHLADPARLWEGASAVYGEATLDRIYGRPVPIAESRMILADDGFELDLGGRKLLFMDTPGHARHHYSIWDERSRGFFSGDTFGMSYREMDSDRGPFMIPTTTPVQFDPEAWNRTLNRYLEFKPQRMFQTHFSMVEDVARLADDLRSAIGAYVHIARRLANVDDRREMIRDALMDYTLDHLRTHNCPLPEPARRGLLDMDMKLNAQGLDVWLNTACPRP